MGDEKQRLVAENPLRSAIRRQAEEKNVTSISESGFLSFLGKCCSKASTTQLPMMVNRMKYSNGPHSMIVLAYLRITLSSLKMYKDDGPCNNGTLSAAIMYIRRQNNGQKATCPFALGRCSLHQA